MFKFKPKIDLPSSSTNLRMTPPICMSPLTRRRFSTFRSVTRMISSQVPSLIRPRLSIMIDVQCSKDCYEVSSPPQHTCSVCVCARVWKCLNSDCLTFEQMFEWSRRHQNFSVSLGWRVGERKSKKSNKLWSLERCVCGVTMAVITIFIILFPFLPSLLDLIFLAKTV